MSRSQLDCIVIGYNELPFTDYERTLRQYGDDTEAYRDLRFSFVDIDGRKLDYIGLMNHVAAEAAQRAGRPPIAEFRSGEIPNLAAVYLTNFLRRAGYTCEYINLFQLEKERLIELLAEGPTCVAITTTFYVINLPVNQIVEFIRRHNSRVKIVVGGPLIANHSRNFSPDTFGSALADIGADIYVIEGQGEATLASVIAALRGNGPLHMVPNIAFHENGRLCRTPPAPENNSLDQNVIDWSAFTGHGPTIQMRTARSCAFKCSFCNYPTRAGALALTSLDVLEREFDSICESGSVNNVVFIDDTFNVPFPRFKEICRLLIRKRYNFDWFSYFRCSNSDREALDLMAESGCKGVFLGIESGSPRILQNMNKAATVEKYEQGIAMLRERGIMSFASLITGFPGETAETVEESKSFLRQTKPDYYRAQMWYCEPGTPIHNQREQFRIEGEGFVWSHATMDSLEAMDHIERMFLEIDESTWMPQWSFDFWIVPYLLGRGISLDRFRAFMKEAHLMLRLEIACLPPHEKAALQKSCLERAIVHAASW